MTQRESIKAALDQLDAANDAAMEICHAGLEWIIPLLRKTNPHTACDAEKLAGLMQKYLQEYGS